MLAKIVCCFLALTATSCNLQSGEANNAPEVNTTPIQSAAAEPSQNRPPRDIEDAKLVLWAPSFFAQPKEALGADALATVYRFFLESNPDVEIVIQAKAENGPSSLQSYFQSASKVAPAILPDIVLIETQKLWPMIEDFEIAPLSEDEAGIHLTDAYPFAQDAVSFNQEIYGIPYAASIIHMVYNRQEFPSTEGEVTVPNSWPDLLSSSTTYRFPAVGQGKTSNDMLLLQYVGAGGQLTPDGSVANPEALTALLNFTAGGAESGLLPPENRDISTTSAAWEKFIADQKGLVNVRSEQYLSQQDALSNLGFASIPTRSGLAVTIGRVWAFILITNEPNKRALALDLIEQLRAPTTHGIWSQNANRLPTHIEAFNSWTDNQPYYDFLRQQMDIALAIPNGEAFAELSRQIQAAEISVFNAEAGAQEAANKVIDSE